MKQTDESPYVTAGELAKILERSSYGVKKALARNGVRPVHVLAGTSFFNRTKALETLQAAMRAPNSKP